MALATKVENRSEALDLLRRLSRHPRAESPQFFEQLVELMPAMFGVDLALIAEFAKDRSRLRTIAIASRGRRSELFEQALAGSLALDVKRGGRVFVATDARKKYPNDQLVRDFALDAYHGVALLDGNGEVTGVLAIAHSVSWELTADAEFMLELLAQRVSSEWTTCAEGRSSNRTAVTDSTSHVAPHPIDRLRIPGPGSAPVPRELFGLCSEPVEEPSVDTERVPKDAPQVELGWYRRYFDLGSLGMVLADPNGHIWDANDCFCEMLKRPRRAVLAESWTDLSHPEDFVDERKLLAEVTEGRSDGYSIDKRFLLPDGSTLLTNVAVRCARGKGHRVEYLALMVQDLTQKRLLEQQLLHSQKLEAVGRLAGGIAHDFNNLLTAILGYTDLTSSADEKAVSEMLMGVRDAAMRAANLTSQLLAFARRQVIEPKVLDLNRVVQSTTHLLGRVVGEDIEIVTGIAQDLWTVRLDPGQVEQILVNMAVNARDAMPKGGRLLIGTGNVPSHMVFEVLGPSATIQDYVLVIIADTGQGMDPETLNHLFEPFFTTKDASKGSGLGLATCHGIVSQNGGHIRVTSSVGYGTTFRIYFPRYSAEPVTAPSVAPSSPSASVCETILLVEDDDMVRRVAVRVLKSKGYKVLSAASGVEALELACSYQGHIDLLLTDLVMPKMNGDRLAQELVPLRPNTRVLFTSGYAESAHDHGLGPGVNFLQKPYTPRQLSERVRRILDK